MAFKHTLIFNYVSGVSVQQGRRRIESWSLLRPSGWSESFVHNSQLSFEDGTRFRTLAVARSYLLPPTIRIVGWRISDLDRLSATTSGRASIPGNAGGNQSIPQYALQASGVGTTGNRMRLILRGLPEEFASIGDLTPTNEKLIDGFRRFVTALAGFGQNVRNLSAAQSDIIRIAANGTITTRPGTLAPVVGDRVRVLRTTDVHSKRRGALLTVSAVTSPTNFIANVWDFGDCTGGRVRAEAFRLCNYIPDALRMEQLIIRKSGSPFFRYRGKRPTQV